MKIVTLIDYLETVHVAFSRIACEMWKFPQLLHGWWEVSLLPLLWVLTLGVALIRHRWPLAIFKSLESRWQ